MGRDSSPGGQKRRRSTSAKTRRSSTKDDKNLNQPQEKSGSNYMAQYGDYLSDLSSYLYSKNVYQTFDMLSKELITRTPDDPIPFLIDFLERDRAAALREAEEEGAAGRNKTAAERLNASFSQQQNETNRRMSRYSQETEGSAATKSLQLKLGQEKGHGIRNMVIRACVS
jgi:hypothetical protein